jgi:Na+-driven multidrug efflux pump
MIATSLGAGDAALARRQAGRLVGWGTAGGLLLGLIYLPLGSVLPGVFTTDADVLNQVGSVWLIVALLQPVGGVVFVLDGVLMGAGDFRFLLGSTATAALAVLAPLGVVALILDWGLVGVWAAMAAMMVVRLAAMVWRWRSGRWAVADVPVSAAGAA